MFHFVIIIFFFLTDFTGVDLDNHVMNTAVKCLDLDVGFPGVTRWYLCGVI